MATIIVKTLRDATPDDFGGTYSAPAEFEFDGETLDCFVIWDITNQDADECCDACDWDKPDGIKMQNAWIADKFEGVNQFDGHTFFVEL